MLAKLAIFAILGFVIYFMLKAKFSPKKDENKLEKTELSQCSNCHTFVEINELKNGLCNECRAK